MRHDRKLQRTEKVAIQDFFIYFVQNELVKRNVFRPIVLFSCNSVFLLENVPKHLKILFFQKVSPNKVIKMYGFILKEKVKP